MKGSLTEDSLILWRGEERGYAQETAASRGGEGVGRRAKASFCGPGDSMEIPPPGIKVLLEQKGVILPSQEDLVRRSGSRNRVFSSKNEKIIRCRGCLVRATRF